MDALKALVDSGVGISEGARRFGVDRKTVYRAIGRGQRGEYKNVRISA